MSQHENRIHNRGATVRRHDLFAAISVALGDSPTPEQSAAAERLRREMDHPEAILRRIRDELGNHAYGAALLFCIQGRTSLSPDAEVQSSPEWLALKGLTVGDLNWPASALHPWFVDQAGDDEGLEARIEAAIAAWRQTL